MVRFANVAKIAVLLLLVSPNMNGYRDFCSKQQLQ